jgi:hypothetical protein
MASRDRREIRSWSPPVLGTHLPDAVVLFRPVWAAMRDRGERGRLQRTTTATKIPLPVGNVSWRAPTHLDRSASQCCGPLGVMSTNGCRCAARELHTQLRKCLRTASTAGQCQLRTLVQRMRKLCYLGLTWGRGAAPDDAHDSKTPQIMIDVADLIRGIPGEARNVAASRLSLISASIVMLLGVVPLLRKATRSCGSGVSSFPSCTGPSAILVRINDGWLGHVFIRAARRATPWRPSDRACRSPR